MAPPSVPVLMDDLVEEILLRFPPDDPASLLRAALVCKVWRRLVSGPGFHRRFREFHRTPPLLGFLCSFGRAGGPFYYGKGDTRFMPAATSFRRLPHAVGRRWCAVDALHGRILFYDTDMVTSQTTELDLFVCSPLIAGEVWRLPTLVPPDVHRWSAGLLCTAYCNCDHIDDDCPFRVVVVSTKSSTGITFAYVYSSEQHAWSMQTSIQHSNVGSVPKQSISARIGNAAALYFKCESDNTLFCLEYHMIKQQLSVISLPSEWKNRLITFMTAENGGLGLASVMGYNLYTLSRGTGMDGQLRWGNKRVIRLSKLLPAVTERMHVAAAVHVLGVILIGTENGLFSLDIKSSKVKKLWEGNVGRHIDDVVPYVSFCTPVMRAAL